MHKSASGKKSRDVNTTILQEIERSTILKHSQGFQTPFSIKIKPKYMNGSAYRLMGRLTV